MGWVVAEAKKSARNPLNSLSASATKSACATFQRCERSWSMHVAQHLLAKPQAPDPTYSIYIYIYIYVCRCTCTYTMGSSLFVYVHIFKYCMGYISIYIYTYIHILICYITLYHIPMHSSSYLSIPEGIKSYPLNPTLNPKPQTLNPKP